jgi:hypothetical protein
VLPFGFDRRMTGDAETRRRPLSGKPFDATPNRTKCLLAPNKNSASGDDREVGCARQMTVVRFRIFVLEDSHLQVTRQKMEDGYTPVSDRSTI